MQSSIRAILAALPASPLAALSAAAAPAIDLSNAVIVLDTNSTVPARTAEMLHDEIARRRMAR